MHNLSRRNFIASVGLGLAAQAIAKNEAARPNIILLITDDHAFQAISAYGSNRNKTPNIDRIANEGMRFDQAFVTNSICAPSRAVILTGKHSHLNGQLTNGMRFDGEQQSFPKLLQKAGYNTAMIGKWHLKSDPTGFDIFDVLIGQGPYYNPPMKTNRTGAVTTEKHTGYTTDLITDKALTWLKEERDESKPFMLMCQHKAPHRNWQPAPRHLTLFDDVEIPEPETLWDDYQGRKSPASEQAMTIKDHLSASDLKLTTPKGLTDDQREKWEAAYRPKNEAFKKLNLQGDDLIRWKYQRYAKDYLRCVTAVDENIGRMLKYLDENGLAENTIVMYTSDQGWYLGEHGWYDKRWMYEESFRTPLIVKWPGVTDPGSVNTDLVQNLDFAQTFLDMAGADQPNDMQGASLLPLLQRKTPGTWRESIFYQYYEFPGAHSVRRHYGVRTKTHKLLHFYMLDEWEMYDLVNDPNELKSVYDDPEYAELQVELRNELTKLRTQYKVPADDRPVKKVQKQRPQKKPKKSPKAKEAEKAGK